MTYSIAIEGCFIGMISLLAFTIGRVFFDGARSPSGGPDHGLRRAELLPADPRL